jgi:hypothetical protein
VEGLSLDLSLFLQSVDHVLAVPAKLVRQTLDGGVLAAWLEPEDAEGLGDDDALLSVVRGRNTFKELDALKGGGTAGGLVRHHTSDGAVKDA